MSASAPLLQPVYPLHRPSCLVTSSNVSAGIGSMVPVNVVQQPPPPLQSIPTLYSSSQPLRNMAAVAMQNIPSFHPEVGSFISQQTLQVQNIPGFVPQVLQQSSLMPGLPVSATLDTPVPSVTDANFTATQCSSIANISSTSALSDSIVKSVNTVKKQLTYSQQPIPSSAIADPILHTSSQSISDSTPQSQTSIMFSRASQQNYQLPNLAQQQSMMENFQQSNFLRENLSILSQSPPQTELLGVSITDQYHPQPDIPQHESRKTTTNASTAPILGPGVTSSDISNVSFQQDMPQNSNSNQASSDHSTASKPNANASANMNTNLVQPISLTIPYASFLQNNNAQVLTHGQFSKVDPLPLQQTAPLILLQQPSPTAYVISGDAPLAPENYTHNTSSVLQYHLRQNVTSDFVPTSSENYALSCVMTPVPTPNPLSTPVPGASNTLPLLNLHPQSPTKNVHSVSETSPILQNAELACKVNQVQNFQAKYGQFQSIVYSSKVDQTLDYETLQSCVNMTYQSNASNVSHINKQLLNVQMNEPPLYDQQFDTQKESQQIPYSASSETKNANKVSEIQYLVQEGDHNGGKMLEEGLHSAHQSVSSKLNKQTDLNHEMSCVKTSDTENFGSQQIHIKEEAQRALKKLKKDQEEIGTQTTPSLDCGSTVVSRANREIGSDSSVLDPVLGDTEEPVQTFEAEQIMQSLTVPTSASDEMAPQGHMQYRRNSSGMSSVQGSPTRSTTKVEDGFFLSRSHNLKNIELQWEHKARLPFRLKVLCFCVRLVFLH